MKQHAEKQMCRLTTGQTRKNKNTRRVIFTQQQEEDLFPLERLSDLRASSGVGRCQISPTYSGGGKNFGCVGAPTRMLRV